MTDSNSDSNDSPFPKPDIPSDAPQDLRILAENMDDMIQSLNALKGTEYTTITLSFVTLLQQVAQLEKLACHSTQLLIDAAPPEAIGSEAHNALITNHNLTHILADASGNALSRLIDWFSHTSAFKGMDADVEMMLKRIKTDWLDKGHH